MSILPLVEWSILCIMHNYEVNICLTKHVFILTL